MKNDRFKFRAWHKPTKRLFEVWSFTPEYVFEHSEIYGLGTPTNPAKTEDCVLEQCTGVRDRKGKLIYEGDILYISENDHYYEVKWVEDLAYYELEAKSEDWMGNICCQLKEIGASEDDYLICGNIHENPELLEAEK